MGSTASNFVTTFTEPRTTPEFEVKPTFDPQVGFSAPRKERVVPVTREDVYNAKISKEDSDVCVGLLIDLMRCKVIN